MNLKFKREIPSGIFFPPVASIFVFFRYRFHLGVVGYLRMTFGCSRAKRSCFANLVLLIIDNQAMKWLGQHWRYRIRDNITKLVLTGMESTRITR